MHTHNHLKAADRCHHGAAVAHRTGTTKHLLARFSFLLAYMPGFSAPATWPNGGPGDTLVSNRCPAIYLANCVPLRFMTKIACVVCPHGPKLFEKKE
jgi:hypothetical protein